MDDQLTDKVVFITGAGAGIGRSIAEHFGREGAVVAVTDIDGKAAAETAGIIEAAGGSARGYALDVTRRADVFDVVAQAARDLGGIDILVNNAGVVGLAKIEEITEAEFDRVYAVNIKGKLWCMQAVAPQLRRRGGGKIINICSIAGKTGGRLPYGHYSSSKAAVWALTMSAAHAFAPDNILVNGVAPGSIIGTEFSRDFNLSNDPDELRATIPLARRGVPDDVAPAVVFLASEGARYLTGELIDVNGGLLMD
jgi:3-oxoacyl-[acyl-carrier protein] reductase